MNTQVNFKGSRTEQNLVTAYLHESQAYARYIYYAKQAANDGYYPIQKLFEDTAANELNHAKVFFKFLKGGQVTVPITADAGIIGTTLENLEISVSEEYSEANDYTEFAKIADAEGFSEIAGHFRTIAKVENRHHDRFMAYMVQVKDGTVWKRTEPIYWECLVCGYIYKGTEPPTKCPGCDHPDKHYRAMDMDI